MPGLRLSLGLSPQLSLRLEHRLSLPETGSERNTFAEDKICNEKEILSKLSTLISDNNFIDRYHFSLEARRLQFSHQVSIQNTKLIRSICDIITVYEAQEALTQKILNLVSSENPSTLSESWKNLLTIYPQEKSTHNLLNTLTTLQLNKIDFESTIRLISAKIDKEYVETSLAWINSRNDNREVYFAYETLAPILSKINAPLDNPTTLALYENVVSKLYMLEREVNGSSKYIAKYITEKGLDVLTKKTILGIPFEALLHTLNIEPSKIETLCSDNDYMQGREIQRRIYNGFKVLSNLKSYHKISEHLLNTLTTSKGLSTALSVIGRTGKDPDFSYPFQAQDQDKLLEKLKLGLIDKSIKKLGLNNEYLKLYLDRIDKDSTFERIGTIATTLTSYPHYKGSQTELLREIIEVTLNGEFTKWRYADEKQLEIIKEGKDSWINNVSVNRIIGTSSELTDHINAIKHIIPSMIQIYQDAYKEPYQAQNAQILSNELALNTEKLKSLPKGNDKKDLGWATSQLREKIQVIESIKQIDELSLNNYNETLTYLSNIKKTNHPMQPSIQWVVKQMHSDLYQSLQRIEIKEVDDLESLLCMGQRPIPHCQNWQTNNSYNVSLLSFVADGNKKIWQVYKQGKPIAMSLARLIEYNEKPMLLLENLYANEWNEDYGIALMDTVAKKTAELAAATGKSVYLAIPEKSGHNAHATNVALLPAFEKFAEDYKVELEYTSITVNPPHSRSTHEYWDCGPEGKKSGEKVELEVRMIEIE